MNLAPLPIPEPTSGGNNWTDFVDFKRPIMPISGQPATRKTNPENIQLRMYITSESLTRKLTAFCTFEELLDRGGYYVPTFDCTNPDCARLADLYDQEQERRGDDRRSFRTGSVEIIASRRYKRFRKGRSPKMIAFTAALALFILPHSAYSWSFPEIPRASIPANHLSCFKIHGDSLDLVDSCKADVSSGVVCFQTLMQEDGSVHPVEVDCCENGRPFCVQNQGDKP